MKQRFKIEIVITVETSVTQEYLERAESPIKIENYAFNLVEGLFKNFKYDSLTSQIRTTSISIEEIKPASYEQQAGESFGKGLI